MISAGTPPTTDPAGNNRRRMHFPPVVRAEPVVQSGRDFIPEKLRKEGTHFLLVMISRILILSMNS